MHPTQSQLFADHHNFTRLLRCMEIELGHYEADEPWKANLTAILEILDYVQFYPEQYHHPMEDAMAELLLAKKVANEEEIHSMRAEHKALEALTRRTSQLFNSVANDSVVPTQELVRVGREFLQRQMAHIDRENHYIYPLMREHLTDLEWDQISAAVEQRKDPLFSRAILDEYRDLYRTIVQSESEVNVEGATARAINRPTAAL